MIFIELKNFIRQYLALVFIDDYEMLLKVVEWSGKILYPVTLNGKYGCKIAEFEDIEGNRIALQQTSNF